MSTDEYSCSIRALQHYMYCPHRWGLIYNECSWMENYFVTKANLLHKRVHDPDRAYTSRRKKVFTSVTVFNDELNLYGVTDCIEVERNNNIPELRNSLYPDESKEKISQNSPSSKNGMAALTIVEYKPHKPKNSGYNKDDLMQVFAQKVCIDWMFKCHAEGVLYYADVKQRVKLPLNENYDEYYARLLFLLEEIKKNIKQGVIPPIRKNQKCRGCSFINLCMPKAERQTQKAVFQQLEEMYTCENC